ncbi:MAG: YIP1 family protein [Myxococcaceae bacterium]
MGTPRLTGAPEEGASLRQPTAWERRRELGFFKALFETWRDSLFAPQRFWPALDPKGPTTDAVLYGLLVAVLGALSQGVLMLSGFGNPLAGSIPNIDRLPLVLQKFFEAMASGASNAGTLLGMVASILVLYPLGLLVSSVLLHGIGLLLGAARNGYGATLRIVAYSAGPLALQFIPVVGTLSGLYQAFLVGLGFRHVQETTPGKAVAVVLMPMVIFCCCCCAGFGTLASSLAALFAKAQTQGAGW